MKTIPPIKLPIPLPVLALVVIALTVLAGVSGLIYPSTYSPLTILGGIIAILIIIAWLRKPVWALYTALFFVFLVPGLIPDNFHSLLNRSITVIAAGVWLIQLLWTRKKMVWTGTALFMFFFLIWSSITLLWAERTNPAMNVLQVYSLRLLLFLLLIPNEINTKRDLDGLMKTLALSGWVLVLSVVVTLLQRGYEAGSRLVVFSANENGIGVMALITMVGVLWQVSQPSKDHQKLRILTTTIFILLTFGLVVMSGSRGSALSLFVTLGFFLIWKPLRPWGILTLLITILTLIFVPSIFNTLVERFAIKRYDTLLGGREVLWQAAWRMIQDHPLGGVGIGNAPYALVSYLVTNARIVGRESVAIHNPLLTIWSETALPGIVFYLGVLMSAMYSFAKQYLKFKSLAHNELIPYFALVSSVAFGYLLSWIKGGGMESDFSYFLILALLTLPSTLNLRNVKPDSPDPATTGKYQQIDS